METARSRFLNYLSKESSGLDYVWLNYLDENIFSRPEREPLEILISKDDYTTLLYIISVEKEIDWLKTKQCLHSQIIKIYFKDLSSITLKIKVALMQQGKVIISAHDVLKSAVHNGGQIKIPSPALQFEYLLLKSMLNHKELLEKYRSYFSKLNFETRSKIFAHMVPKYKLSINLLDDLYEYSSGNSRKFRHVIDNKKRNSGFSFLKNQLQFIFYVTGGLLYHRWQQYGHMESAAARRTSFSQNLKNFLSKNAVIRISE